MTQHRLRVVIKGHRSQPFTQKVDVPEGKTLSALEYCLQAAAECEELAVDTGMGIGLDPPKCALRAFYAARDGKDAVFLDTEEVDTWLTVLTTGHPDWDNVMRSASSDAVRLAILSRVSKTTIGPRVYVDDLRVKLESRAQAVVAVKLIKESADKHHATIKYGITGTAILAQGFKDRRPIDQACFTDLYTGLGFLRRPDVPPWPHLNLVDTRARQLLNRHMSLFEHFNFAFWAVNRCVSMCTQPASCFGLALCINCPTFQSCVNKIQMRWAKRILGLQAQLPLVVLLYELGWEQRLATYYWGMAVMLLQRSRVNPKYRSLAEILTVAAQHSGTWTEAVETFMRRHCIRPFRELYRNHVKKSPSSLKRSLREYRNDHVRKRIKLSVDDRWRAQSAQQAQLARHTSGDPTISDLSNLGLQINEIQAWAQLRIQKYFRINDSRQIVSCRLCSLGAETSNHLILDCPGARPLLHNWAEQWGIDIPRTGP